MKQSQVNHLRRLLGWVRCEAGQSPEELVDTVRSIGAAGVAPTTDAARQRLVEAHDKARAVPKYVRDAIKALEPLTRPGDVVDGGAREVGRIDR